MNLPCMTKWPKYMGEIAGEPTYFIEQIWNSFSSYKPGVILPNPNLINSFKKSEVEKIYLFNKKIINAKPHTIRPGTRWKKGTKIHFHTWTGRPYHSDHFKFAPVLEVFSTQEIEIKYGKRFSLPFKNEIVGMKKVDLLIDGQVKAIAFKYDDGAVKVIHSFLNKFAKNDGFPSVKGRSPSYYFFKYFKENFKGTLIHWTNLRYEKLVNTAKIA